LHLLESGPGSLPGIERLVREELAPRGCNVLVYEIDCNFTFQSHPEVASRDPWTVESVRRLVSSCAAEGIRVIPQFQSLGHQSWKEPPGPLLTAHPEFEEPPDGRTELTRLNSGKFYCRSWCPRHPAVNRFVFDLLDELIEAFGCNAFHLGMDEVFVLASADCPRCKGGDPAEIYASAVCDLHGHLASRGVETLVWADRFLDGVETKLGLWEASMNGTAPAIGMVPKNIVMCDWHYESTTGFPSLDIFANAGFRTWPTVWKNPEPNRAFLAAARAHAGPLMLGALATVWCPAGRMLSALSGGSATDEESVRMAAIAREALAVLEEARSGKPTN